MTAETSARLTASAEEDLPLTHCGCSPSEILGRIGVREASVSWGSTQLFLGKAALTRFKIRRQGSAWVTELSPAVGHRIGSTGGQRRRSPRSCGSHTDRFVTINL